MQICYVGPQRTTNSLPASKLRFAGGPIGLRFFMLTGVKIMVNFSNFLVINLDATLVQIDSTIHFDIAFDAMKTIYKNKDTNMIVHDYGLLVIWKNWSLCS